MGPTLRSLTPGSLPEEPAHRPPIHAREGVQLDNIQSPLAVLCLRHEGLIAVEPFGDLCLGEPRVLPRLTQTPLVKRTPSVRGDYR